MKHTIIHNLGYIEKLKKEYLDSLGNGFIVCSRFLELRNQLMCYNLYPLIDGESGIKFVNRNVFIKEVER